MGRLSSALLVLGLLSGALAKPKVCVLSLFVSHLLNISSNVDAASDLVPKSNEYLDIPLFFTPLVLSPCTSLIESLPLPQPRFRPTPENSLTLICH